MSSGRSRRRAGQPAIPYDGPTSFDAGVFDLPERTLGAGRHPIAAGPDGFAVAVVDTTEDEPRILLQTFDEFGQRLHLVDAGAGTKPPFFADPVVAALPDGAFAVAYTEFGGDADGLGIALRRVSASGTVSSPVYANQGKAFAQYDPDILYAGNTLYVAWTDDSDAASGPDIRYRRFDANLSPLEGEQTLGNAATSEGRVSLFEFKNFMGAAWRVATTDGKEKIVVRADGKEWRTEAFLPGPALDLPSVVSLDNDHLLVAFTKGTDPSGTGVANLPFVYVALLRTAAPGDVTSVPGEGSTDPYVPFYAHDQPSLMRVNDQVFMTGRLLNLPSFDNGDEIYRKEFAWNPTGTPTSITMVDRLIPSEIVHSGPEDQRFPATVYSPYNGGAIFTAWDTHRFDEDFEHGQPDVLLALEPVPFGPGGG